MDHLDLSILSMLQEDGRRSYTDLAKRLGVTEGTVRKRVARLIEDDTIRIIGLVDPHKVGFDAPAMVQVAISPPNLLPQAISAIQRMHTVSYLLSITGEYDLLVELRCRDRDHLAACLAEIQQVRGVTKTVSSMVLDTHKLAEVSVLEGMLSHSEP